MTPRTDPAQGEGPVPPQTRPASPRRNTDEQGRLLLLTEEELRDRLEEDLAILRSLRDITDESDTDELWDEILRNLGVDPETGRSLAP